MVKTWLLIACDTAFFTSKLSTVELLSRLTNEHYLQTELWIGDLLKATPDGAPVGSFGPKSNAQLIAPIRSIRRNMGKRNSNMATKFPEFSGLVRKKHFWCECPELLS